MTIYEYIFLKAMISEVYIKCIVDDDVFVEGLRQRCQVRKKLKRGKMVT